MITPAADRQAVLILPTYDEPAADVVREWVCQALIGVPVLPRLHTALVVEELVSNARLHGRAPCVLRLVLDRTRRSLRVFVEDCEPGTRDVWPRGGGLTLVDGLSLARGVERRARGKTVWAEIALGARAAGLAMPPQPVSGEWPRHE
jgi:hypothetical protein